MRQCGSAVAPLGEPPFGFGGDATSVASNQIEFNFRDVKQFWGLEDFMNLGHTAVTNAANLSFFMVNLSHYLLAQFRQDKLFHI